MKVEIRVSSNFKKEAKPLLKKYPSFLDDLAQLEYELLDNPQFGTPLGHNAYKIRLRIKSKGRGKSGGARVISYLETEVVVWAEKEEDWTIVNLLSVYDKSEKETLSDADLQRLIAGLSE